MEKRVNGKSTAKQKIILAAGILAIAIGIWFIVGAIINYVAFKGSEKEYGVLESVFAALIGSIPLGAGRLIISERKIRLNAIIFFAFCVSLVLLAQILGERKITTVGYINLFVFLIEIILIMLGHFLPDKHVITEQNVQK